MAGTRDDLLDDLVDEYDRLEAILAGLDDDAWLAPSAAKGWTVRDVVVHLAQTEEGAVATLAAPATEWTTRDRPLDDVIDERVAADDAPPAEVFARWKAARRASVDAFRRADPTTTVSWAAAPLKPMTLATTRLAEHWAHALDICEPLGIELPDTDRLRHIAWLGHATLPYAMRLAGLEPIDVHCALDAPDGDDVWTFGPDTAAARVRGAAGAFCRVGARRLAATESGLVVSGAGAAAALEVLRNYAA